MSRLRIAEVRPALPRKFIVLHQRRRLIDAIIELTVERGYWEMTVSEIVKRARMARTTFYENFSSKEDLFLVAVDAILAEAAAAVEAACKEAGSDWGDILRALLVFADERPAAMRVGMVDALAVPAGLARYEATVQRYAELMRVQVPVGTGLPETTEEMLVGGIASVIRRRFRSGPGGGQFINLLPELTEFVAVPYRNALTVT